MSTETLREREDTWRFQRILVLIEDGTETLFLDALVDNCSDRSCVFDRKIREMGLWDRVEKYGANRKPANRVYLRLLHKLTSKAAEDETFSTSKLKSLHRLMVKLFRFEESTWYRACIRGLTGPHRYYSMGTITLRYCFHHKMKDGDQISRIRWQEHVFLVIETSDGDDMDFDLIMGRDSGVCDERWYQQHIPRRPLERRSVHRTAAAPSPPHFRNGFAETSNTLIHERRRRSI